MCDRASGRNASHRRSLTCISHYKRGNGLKAKPPQISIRHGSMTH